MRLIDAIKMEIEQENEIETDTETSILSNIRRKVPSSPREFFAKLYESPSFKHEKEDEVETQTEKSASSIIWGNIGSLLKEKGM